MEGPPPWLLLISIQVLVWRPSCATVPAITSLDVQCSGSGIAVKMDFDHPFNGIVYSKGHFSNSNCWFVGEKSGRNSFSFVIPLTDCGTEQSSKGTPGTADSKTSYENTLVVQNDVQYQEIWDSAKKISCIQSNIRNKVVAFKPFMVDMLDVITVSFEEEKLDCWMDVQRGKFPSSSPIDSAVKVGEDLTVVIYLRDPNNNFDVLVRDCYAYDRPDYDSPSTTRLQLTDQNGCPVKTKLIDYWRRTLQTGTTGATIIAFTTLQAFRFPDTNDIFLTCNVQVCKDGCDQRCPGEPTLPVNIPITPTLPPGISFSPDKRIFPVTLYPKPITKSPTTRSPITFRPITFPVTRPPVTPTLTPITFRPTKPIVIITYPPRVDSTYRIITFPPVKPFPVTHPPVIKSPKPATTTTTYRPVTSRPTKPIVIITYPPRVDSTYRIITFPPVKPFPVTRTPVIKSPKPATTTTTHRPVTSRPTRPIVIITYPPTTGPAFTPSPITKPTRKIIIIPYPPVTVQPFTSVPRAEPSHPPITIYPRPVTTIYPPITLPPRPITRPPITPPPITLYPKPFYPSVPFSPFAPHTIPPFSPVTIPSVTFSPFTQRPVTRPPETFLPFTQIPLIFPPITRPSPITQKTDRYYPPTFRPGHHDDPVTRTRTPPTPPPVTRTFPITQGLRRYPPSPFRPEHDVTRTRTPPTPPPVTRPYPITQGPDRYPPSPFRPGHDVTRTRTPPTPPPVTRPYPITQGPDRYPPSPFRPGSDGYPGTRTRTPPIPPPVTRPSPITQGPDRYPSPTFRPGHDGYPSTRTSTPSPATRPTGRPMERPGWEGNAPPDHPFHSFHYQPIKLRRFGRSLSQFDNTSVDWNEGSFDNEGTNDDDNEYGSDEAQLATVCMPTGGFVTGILVLSAFATAATVLALLVFLRLRALRSMVQKNSAAYESKEQKVIPSLSTCRSRHSELGNPNIQNI